ncbi:hypothetical protein HK100_006423 [Physocladia obscura]|uniref:Uncharacterized protein n=1 Tax=Physocladia obscura TaxID=109957 RepID=A0AAD5SW63_9FUNG|nr:hypothetical protein HK100_006423 [Physocladia obscura]
MHGFPSSSHMFRNLIPRLNGDFHVVAADLPGDFLRGRRRGSGGARGVAADPRLRPPVALRLHHSNPTRVAAFVVQNANAYKAGLTPAFQPIIDYGNDQSDVNERSVLNFETAKFQFLHGMPDVTLVSPDAIISCQYTLDTPGNDTIQLSYFADYNSSIALYDTWHADIRRNQPAVLVLFRKNDPFFF